MVSAPPSVIAEDGRPLAAAERLLAIARRRYEGDSMWKRLHLKVGAKPRTLAIVGAPKLQVAGRSGHTFLECAEKGRVENVGCDNQKPSTSCQRERALVATTRSQAHHVRGNGRW